jgi:hypothetical protein
MSKFQQRDIVYYDDNRLIVLAGPFRSWTYPTVDQYLVGAASLDDPEHVWGRQGPGVASWASDLCSEADHDHEAWQEEE